jgi:hypothetical protein
VQVALGGVYVVVDVLPETLQQRGLVLVAAGEVLLLEEG